MAVSNTAYFWLGAAILSVWLPVRKPILANLWIALFIVSIAELSVSHGVDPIGIISIAIVSIIVFSASRVTSLGWRVACRMGGLIAALVLGLHVLPGFHPATYSLDGDESKSPARLHFDSGSAGLLVLALLCRDGLVRSFKEFKDVIRSAAPAAVFTLLAPIAAAFAIGVARLTFHVPQGTLWFVATNLLFTCVGEEAAFRGVIQTLAAEWFGWQLSSSRGWVPVMLSTALFAAAHSAGGASAVVLVAIAGLGYGLAYAVTKRLEVSILVHLALNVAVFAFLKLV